VVGTWDISLQLSGLANKLTMLMPNVCRKRSCLRAMFMMLALAMLVHSPPKSQLCESNASPPLIGRKGYFDMLAKMKKADTESQTSIAKTYSAAAKQIAGEALPMLIWIPLGKRAFTAVRDINRDFWRARVEVANQKSRRAIAGTAGKTVGICIVTLAVTLLIHAWLRSRELAATGSSTGPWYKGPGGALAVLIVILLVALLWLLRSGFQISELMPTPDMVAGWSGNGHGASLPSLPSVVTTVTTTAAPAGDQVQWL